MKNCIHFTIVKCITIIQLFLLYLTYTGKLYYRMHLHDVEVKREEIKSNNNALYALRRGLQLRNYVTGIRTDLHETRAAEKRERQNRAIAE